MWSGLKVRAAGEWRITHAQNRSKTLGWWYCISVLFWHFTLWYISKRILVINHPKMKDTSQCFTIMWSLFLLTNIDGLKRDSVTRTPTWTISTFIPYYYSSKASKIFIKSELYFLIFVLCGQFKLLLVKIYNYFI